MGETKASTEAAKAKNEVKMISVEQANAQMQNFMQQANTKIQQITAHAQQLDAMLRDKTVEHLFKVVEYAEHFNTEFVVKCISALESYITSIALTEPEKESKEEIPATAIDKE